MKFQMLGDANKAGPVRLSDVYDSEVGGASTGIAASQKALYDAYNSLNSRIHYFDITKTYTSKTSLAYTGISYTIPKKSVFTMYGVTVWANSAPACASINDSSSNANAQIACGYRADGCTSATPAFSYHTGNSAVTYYLWAKYNGSGSNWGYLRGFYISLQ